VRGASGNNFEKTLTISVIDANEAPTDISLDVTGIAENSPTGTVIGNLSAADPDAGDTHTYTLLDNAGGRFAIDGTQLKVADGSLLDFESAGEHTVRVLCAVQAV
jgi:hypothetical protein